MAAPLYIILGSVDIRGSQSCFDVIHSIKLEDPLCEKNDLSLVIRAGLSLSRWFLAPTGRAGLQPKTRGYSWRRCCGKCGSGRRGATFRAHSGRGTACFGGFADGRKLMFLNEYSRRYRMTRTLSMPLLTARSSMSTKRRRAQKGDSSSGDRALERRAHDQNPSAYRRGRGAGALQIIARPAQRIDRRSKA